jgi:hypothetical protein
MQLVDSAGRAVHPGFGEIVGGLDGAAFPAKCRHSAPARCHARSTMRRTPLTLPGYHDPTLSAHIKPARTESLIALQGAAWEVAVFGVRFAHRVGRRSGR